MPRLRYPPARPRPRSAGARRPRPKRTSGAQLFADIWGGGGGGARPQRRGGATPETDDVQEEAVAAREAGTDRDRVPNPVTLLAEVREGEARSSTRGDRRFKGRLEQLLAHPTQGLAVNMGIPTAYNSDCDGDGDGLHGDSGSRGARSGEAGSGERAGAAERVRIDYDAAAAADVADVADDDLQADMHNSGALTSAALRALGIREEQDAGSDSDVGRNSDVGSNSDAGSGNAPRTFIASNLVSKPPPKEYVGGLAIAKTAAESADEDGGEANRANPAKASVAGGGFGGFGGFFHAQRRRGAHPRHSLGTPSSSSAARARPSSARLRCRPTSVEDEEDEADAAADLGGLWVQHVQGMHIPTGGSRGSRGSRGTTRDNNGGDGGGGGKVAAAPPSLMMAADFGGQAGRSDGPAWRRRMGGNGRRQGRGKDVRGFRGTGCVSGRPSTAGPRGRRGREKAADGPVSTRVKWDNAWGLSMGYTMGSGGAGGARPKRPGISPPPPPRHNGADGSGGEHHAVRVAIGAGMPDERPGWRSNDQEDVPPFVFSPPSGRGGSRRRGRGKGGGGGGGSGNGGVRGHGQGQGRGGEDAAYDGDSFELDESFNHSYDEDGDDADGGRNLSAGGGIGGDFKREEDRKERRKEEDGGARFLRWLKLRRTDLVDAQHLLDCVVDHEGAEIADLNDALWVACPGVRLGALFWRAAVNGLAGIRGRNPRGVVAGTKR